MSQESNFSSWIHGELEDLRRVRDELRVKGHLAKAELRDGWSKLEERFHELERRAKQVGRAAGSSASELEADARKLAGDLRDGYRRIRDSI